MSVRMYGEICGGWHQGNRKGMPIIYTAEAACICYMVVIGGLLSICWSFLLKRPILIVACIIR